MCSEVHVRSADDFDVRDYYFNWKKNISAAAILVADRCVWTYFEREHAHMPICSCRHYLWLKYWVIVFYRSKVFSFHF